MKRIVCLMVLLAVVLLLKESAMALPWSHGKKEIVSNSCVMSYRDSYSKVTKVIRSNVLTIYLD